LVISTFGTGTARWIASSRALREVREDMDREASQRLASSIARREKRRKKGRSIDPSGYDAGKR